MKYKNLKNDRKQKSVLRPYEEQRKLWVRRQDAVIGSIVDALSLPLSLSLCLCVCLSLSKRKLVLNTPQVLIFHLTKKNKQTNNSLSLSIYLSWLFVGSFFSTEQHLSLPFSLFLSPSIFFFASESSFCSFFFFFLTVCQFLPLHIRPCI